MAQPPNRTPGSINLDPDLVAILCCPETKQSVTLADASLVAHLNVKIDAGEVKNKGGQVVTEKVDGGLVRSDKKTLYPVREDIPVMLIEEGIPLEGLV